MDTVILIGHILLGILTCLLALHKGLGLDKYAKQANKIYPFVVLSVGLSGIGLVLVGGSLTRACASGVVIMAMALVFQKITQHITSNKISKKELIK